MAACQRRIVCIGDSITEGSVDNSGPTQIMRPTYRRDLWNTLEAAGFCVDFVGTKRGGLNEINPASPDFDQDHFGWFGKRSDEVFNLLNVPTAFQADIALIHLGTNDVWQGMGAGFSAQQVAAWVDLWLRQIIGLLHNGAYDPYGTMEIVVAKIIPLSNDPAHPGVNMDAGVQATNGMIAALTSLPRVHVVDMYSNFILATMTHDQVHPNATGEAFMAARWATELSLPTLLGSPDQSAACFLEIGRGCGTPGSPTDPRLRIPVPGAPMPILGQTFNADVVNLAPGSAVFGLASTQQALIPTAPPAALGCYVFADPTTGILTFLGVAPSGTFSSWSLAIPANPALAGVEQFWQSFAIDPANSTAVSNAGIVRAGFPPSM